MKENKNAHTCIIGFKNIPNLAKTKYLLAVSKLSSQFFFSNVKREF